MELKIRLHNTKISLFIRRYNLFDFRIAKKLQQNMHKHNFFSNKAVEFLKLNRFLLFLTSNIAHYKQ